MKDMNVAKFIKELKKGEFYHGCAMPIGYTAGLPMLSVVAGKPCLKIPYLKYKVTGLVDKTLVFPIRYVLTYSLVDQKPVGFEDLAYNPVFKKVDFNKPIGYFRHDAVKNLSKKEYEQKRTELFSLYDGMIEALLKKTGYASVKEFKTGLNLLLEPSLKPIYKALDKGFYDNFLA